MSENTQERVLYNNTVASILYSIHSKNSNILGGRIMVIHNLKNGMYSIKIKGLDRKFITNSWVEAMEIAWILGGGKND